MRAFYNQRDGVFHMKFRLSSRQVVGLFWILTCLAIVIWSQVPRFSQYTIGWDLQVYRNAAHSLTEGQDPYVDGMAVQEEFHRTFAQHPLAPPPYTYVYSPITIPLLRLATHFPHLLCMTLYWIVYGFALAAGIWVSWKFVEEKERRYFQYALPAVVFFAGLLQNDVFFSGNVAYLVYGFGLLAAWRGWRTNDWKWYCLVVLCASCYKAPFLTLLAVPVLSAYKQWLLTFVTGAAGVAIFVIQPRIWPAEFHHYLQAVELQFSYNHDFSSSPAGLLADALYYRVPYQITSAAFYALYALLFGAILFYLSRKYLAGYLSQKQWVPVMMVGVVLLNPRIMEYDVAPITLFMALVLWRFWAAFANLRWTIIGSLGVFAIVNICAPTGWRTIECFTLCGLFLGGSWTLYKQARQAERSGIGAGKTARLVKDEPTMLVGSSAG
jgi:hypothetical protein